MSASASRAGLLAVLLAGACGQEPPEVPPPSRLTLGVHELELRVPEGWLHLDEGREHRFKQDLRLILLLDMGPATPAGFHREVSRARDLLSEGRSDLAHAILAGLRPRRVFPGERRWAALSSSWSVLLRGGKAYAKDPERVRGAYREVLARLEELPPPDLPSIAEAAIEELPLGAHREILEREALEVGGREAFRIDTWDRLSHAMRKRHVFVLNEGSLLVAGTDLGDFTEVQPVFDALIASMTLAPRDPALEESRGE